MAPPSAVAARRRYLTLLGLRWLPVGLLIPVLVLLPLERGLTLAQYGAVAAAQGLVVLLLELPTGGLADALGRRPVLLLAGVVAVASLSVLLTAGTTAAFAAAYVLQGVYRALDSGPLESWYVDAALAADPAADFETGLSRGGVVSGLAIAAGALGGGGLVALGPRGGLSALTVPVVVALAVQVAALVTTAVLLREPHRAVRGGAALAASVRGVPAAVGGALRLARRSRVVRALVAVELFWGFGMVTFESLVPVKLTDVIGDADRASALLGPAGSAAWLASAAGAALVPYLSRRAGARWTGFALRIAQGLTVVGMGLAGGAAGVVGAYLLCYTVHGASNPVHSGLLHRQVDGPHRTSLVSLNSMVAQPAGALGLVVLTAVAQWAGAAAAIVAGGAVLAAAAPLYLVRGRPAPSAEEFATSTAPGMSSASATPGGTPCSPSPPPSSSASG